MKKFLIIALAIVCGVAVSESFAQKPKKEKMTEAKIDSLRAAHERIMNQMENDGPLRTGPARDFERISKKELLELYSKIIQLEKRIDKLEALASPPKSPTIPCLEESVDSDQSYHGFGVGKGYDQNIASTNAVTIAIEELTKRIFPLCTNEKMQLVSKNCQIICRQIEIQDTGFYQCYVVISVNKNDIQ